MARAVKEWVGATDDAKAPPRVRMRVFEDRKHICHISGREIMPGEPWELDHVVALINGGQNRESNLAPALKDKHKLKTARDVAEKAEMAAKVQKHHGVTRPAGDIKSAPFIKSEKAAKRAAREPKKTLEPRKLYV